jgi:hypothetical protein
MSRRPLAGFALLATLSPAAIGCGLPSAPPASPPPYHHTFSAEANGQPLNVQNRRYAYNAKEEREVGRRVTSTSSGYSAESVQYATVNVRRQGYEYWVEQGDKRVDNLSALNISGDKRFRDDYLARTAAVEANRKNARPYFEENVGKYQTTMTVGWLTMAIGYTLAVAGGALAFAFRKDGKFTPPGIVMLASAPIGSIAGTVGFFVYNGAKRSANAEAAKAEALARDEVKPSDFSKHTTEENLRAVADKYNASIRPAEPAVPVRTEGPAPMPASGDRPKPVEPKPTHPRPRPRR